MKNRFLLILSFVLMASGVSDGEEEAFVSRRYSLARLCSSVEHASTSRSFGLVKTSPSPRPFKVMDQCGFEECIVQLIPGKHWKHADSEFIYSDDEVVICQSQKVHKSIEALLDELHKALVRPLRLEIRCYAVNSQTLLRSLKPGLALSEKEAQALQKQIQLKQSLVLSKRFIHLRVGEQRRFSELDAQTLFDRRHNDPTESAAESYELVTGDSLTVSALCSKDRTKIDLKILMESATPEAVKTQHEGDFFLQQATLHRKSLLAGLRVTWNKDYVLAQSWRGQSGRLVLVRVTQRASAPKNQTLRSLPISVLDNRWSLPSRPSPWLALRIGPQAPAVNERKQEAMLEGHFISDLPESKHFAMSGWVYSPEKAQSSVFEGVEQRFQERRCLRFELRYKEKIGECWDRWAILSDQGIQITAVDEHLDWTGLRRQARLIGLRRWIDREAIVSPVARGFSAKIYLTKTDAGFDLCGQLEGRRVLPKRSTTFIQLVRPQFQIQNTVIQAKHGSGKESLWCLGPDYRFRASLQSLEQPKGTKQ